MTEERDRLADLVSDKLMEELAVIVDDLDPKPTDAVSKYKALKELKEARSPGRSPRRRRRRRMEKEGEEW